MYIFEKKPFFIGIFLFSAFLSGCSFNYNDGLDYERAVPDMVFMEASAGRYENAQLSMLFSARLLEIYDTDRIWAGEGVFFTEYSGNGAETIEAEGSAGVMLINDEAEIYSLGMGASFYVVSDSIYLRAPDLRWQKKQHHLSAPHAGLVEIEKDDGSIIRGTGFFADTLSHSYSFENEVSGILSRETGESDENSGQVPENDTNQDGTENEQIP
ncbi:hypothetical protein K7I13_07520 [Brucepastera parasyntrophica]|uniref:hypothetical protein n=1 Tax=Brucepastera parasyntrophica TaxID=2880008 RepID=UPI00210B1F65|nr:hypothetical protein [Brucepastera parasyntrophica]ULQ61092.1 hypothetical protein K7I13_07520 [Brucepastera parasyntrophica]